MDTIYKCPVCKMETIGTKNANNCGAVCICPHCQRGGNVVYMEEQKADFYCNMGSGLFSKKKLV